LAENAENHIIQPWGGGGAVGRGRSLPSANPHNVAAGGATDARCGGGEGGEEGWHGTDNSTWQPLFLFLLVFLSVVRPAGVR
jgi:hypothetical protein